MFPPSGDRCSLIRGVPSSLCTRSAGHALYFRNNCRSATVTAGSHSHSVRRSDVTLWGSPGFQTAPWASNSLMHSKALEASYLEASFFCPYPLKRPQALNYTYCTEPLTLTSPPGTQVGFGELLHCCDGIGRCGLDVVVLRDGYRAVPQNALDHRIMHAQAVQIRSQAPAEPMPSMPRDPSTFEHVLHFPLIASVQVDVS
jgi:hypothetical protein